MLLKLVKQLRFGIHDGYPIESLIGTIRVVSLNSKELPFITFATKNAFLHQRHVILLFQLQFLIIPCTNNIRINVQ